MKQVVSSISLIIFGCVIGVLIQPIIITKPELTHNPSNIELHQKTLTKDQKNINNSQSALPNSTNREYLTKALENKKPLQVETVKLAVKEMYGFNSVGKVYLLLMNASDQELIDILDQLTLGSVKENYDATRILMVVLIERNLELAIDYMEQRLVGRHEGAMVFNFALYNWSQIDASEALAWYQLNKSNFETNLKGSKGKALVNIMSHLTEQNPQKAIETLEQFSSSDHEIGNAMRGVIKKLEHTADFQSLYDVTFQVSRPLLETEFIITWTEKNPQQAAEWAQSLDNENQEKIMGDIFSTWSSKNIEEAANWYLAQASSEKRQEHANKISQDFGFSDPDAGLIWLSQQENIDKTASALRLFTGASAANPEFVFENIELIDRESVKVPALFQAYLSAKRRNHDTANELVANSIYREVLETRISEHEKHR